MTVDLRGARQDKLNHFWIIAKKQLEDKKADLRNKEREIQVCWCWGSC